MGEDGNEPIDPLAAIKHLLPDLPVEAGWLGENYRGWQRFANALKIVSEEYDFPMTCKPKNGYLQVDYPFAPPHLITLGYAIEMATDQICQYCGRPPAREEVRNGWVWKLCDRCIRQSAGLPADSTRIWTPIPRTLGQRFHADLDTHSTSTWTVISH